MTTLKVKTDSLNLRSSPEIANDNIIGVLNMAQSVEVISGGSSDRFLKVEANIGGATKQGFASQAFLRELVSDRKEALISAAVKEWLRFDRGQKVETDNPQVAIVGEYWKAIGLNLDGNDTDLPWSAAFISFAARAAGYSNFKFAQSHSTYVHDAVDKRRANDTNAPFWGFNVSDRKPQLGDLVCRTPSSSNFPSIDSIPSGGFPSHCDIIVEVKDSEVRTIGGNVSNSVSITSYALDASGFLKSGSKRVYGILKNNF
jgi:hypothetical protein